MMTAILVLMLASGLMAGMFAAVVADQRSHTTDRDQTLAYAAAHAGLEKLTANLGNLFQADFSPSGSDVNAIDDFPPTIPGFEFVAPGSSTPGSGFDVDFTAAPPGPNAGNPQATVATITTGPFEGLTGLITPYTVNVTARSTTRASEVRLRRELQTVAVPVFQFGIFGEKTLGFHAGPEFAFGGRVHTNESLYLAGGGGGPLIFGDRVTAFVEVVRNRLVNQNPITNTGHVGAVKIPKVIGGAQWADYRDLGANEGSGTTAAPAPGWYDLSTQVYNANIRTEVSGAKRLNLPLTADGAQPIDLIRRPPATEAETSPVFGQRYFAQASLRILLSDRAADITNLATVTPTAPVELTAAGLAAAGYVPAAGRPNVTVSPGVAPVLQTRVLATGNPMTVEWRDAAAGAWTADVPAWMRWNTLTINGAAVNCHTLTATGALTCPTHPAYTAGQPVVFTMVDGSTVPATVNANVAANANPVQLAAFSTALKFAATRGFFVHKEYVTCTGFSRTAGTSPVPTQLTGCTVANGGTIANSNPIYTGATAAVNTSLLGGFLKIERQDATGTWTDVTLELLNLGFAAPNDHGSPCLDPTPNAVIRLQRLRDNGLTAVGGCTGAGNYSTSLVGTDYWPINLYDARDAWTRTIATTSGMHAGGVTGLVTLDATNLARWFSGAIAGTGNQASNNGGNGYIVYFSDRRGDHNENNGDVETGEYGHEDSINPNTVAWAKSNTLDGGEDVNENGTLETYGETPHSLVYGCAAWAACVGPQLPFDSTVRPWTTIPVELSGQGRLARQVLFRRALKVTRGGLGMLPPGFTIAAENAVYVHGDFNANGAVTPTVPTWANQEPNVPTAIIADAVTLLSNSWRDAVSFQRPNDQFNRVAATNTAYRFAMITGKGRPFAKPNVWSNTLNTEREFGSDGGVHNFMRMLENWGGRYLFYRGSMVSLYYSRQAIGTYRADGNVYNPPTRGYRFDSDFLTPALLPPGTPMFRDVNTLRFRQILRPNQ